MPIHVVISVEFIEIRNCLQISDSSRINWFIPEIRYVRIVGQYIVFREKDQ